MLHKYTFIAFSGICRCSEWHWKVYKNYIRHRILWFTIPLSKLYIQFLNSIIVWMSKQVCRPIEYDIHSVKFSHKMVFWNLFLQNIPLIFPCKIWDKYSYTYNTSPSYCHAEVEDMKKNSDSSYTHSSYHWKL